MHIFSYLYCEFQHLRRTFRQQLLYYYFYYYFYYCFYCCVSTSIASFSS